MAKKNDILFEAFERLTKEYDGRVSRGGIFTSSHPRLKGTITGRQLSVFFQIENRICYLCIRISDAFPFLLVVKPRYRIYGTFNLDMDYNIEEVESAFPLFVIKANEVEKGRELVSRYTFEEYFHRLMSPKILEKRFAGSIKDIDISGTFTENGYSPATEADSINIGQSIETIAISQKGYFFFPYIILDRKGAFLKVRFDHYLNDQITAGMKESAMIEVDPLNEMNEIIANYINTLNSMLDEGKLNC